MGGKRDKPEAMISKLGEGEVLVWKVPRVRLFGRPVLQFHPQGQTSLTKPQDPHQIHSRFTPRNLCPHRW